MSERRLAVLLAGGNGTRLKPYTAVFPKPLVPVGDYPIIDILMRQLFAARFTEFVIAVGHLAPLLQAYFVDHPLRSLGASITFSHEREAMGTAGPLRLIPHLPEHFLVLNGDIMTDLEFGSFFAAHCASRAHLTIATTSRAVPFQLGIVEREGRRVVGYQEKPRLTYEVSMGAYAYCRDTLDLIAGGRRVDVPELVVASIEAGRHVAAYPVRGEWLDIGNPDDYALAQERMAADPLRYVPPLMPV
jgi:NDP-sugar pyrophosphorylase family protein